MFTHLDFCNVFLCIELSTKRSSSNSFKIKLNLTAGNLENPENTMVYYVMLRGVDRFYSEYNMYPGEFEDQVEPDIVKLKVWHIISSTKHFSYISQSSSFCRNIHTLDEICICDHGNHCHVHCSHYPLHSEIQKLLYVSTDFWPHKFNVFVGLYL